MREAIGILGGISPASTAYYYSRLVAAYRERCLDERYPEILIRSLDFERFTEYERSGNLPAYTDYILDGLNSLARGGADFAVMAANSPHAVYDTVAPRSSIPVLSIVDSVASHVQTQGFRRILLLGIRFTVEQGFYQKRLEELGIDVAVPTDADQDEIDEVIFGELSVDRAGDASRSRVEAVIAKHDCDGVLLGCTELPLLFTNTPPPIPAIDTASLHVQAALDRALGNSQSAAKQ